MKMLLKETAKSGGSKKDRIIYAINNVHRAQIVYNDKKGGKGKQSRFILPVACGYIGKMNRLAVRAFETMGSTKRGLRLTPSTPKGNPWKLFLVDNIVSWSNGSRSFIDYKDSLIKQGMNLNGDKGMNRIVALSPWCNKGDIDQVNPSMPIDSNPISKSDVDPVNNKDNQSVKTNNPSVSKTNQSAANIGNEKNIGNNIYNNKKSDIINNKLNAPNTTPIKKSDIQTQNDNVPTETGDNTLNVQNNTEPVQKSDISNNGPSKNSELAKKYKDMMDRMNNLYNNEEDKI